MQSARAYLELTRLHKPFMGNTLLFWPCAWGLTLAARGVAMPLDVYAAYMACFFAGSMLDHSANCILNDIWDVEFDRLVERTKSRPLPSGRASLRGAIALFAILSLPTMYLLSYANSTTAILALLGIFPIQGLYPLMKRWTYWPQAWLGLSFNWGVAVGWAAVTGDYPPPAAWVLAVGGTWHVWTIFYDTIYACQDREDDKRVGIKSTAVLFGTRVRPILTAFAAAFAACLVLSGAMLGLGPAYSLLACGGTLAHLGWQLWAWNDKSVRDSMLKFESNGFLASLIWLGMFGEYLSVLNRGFASW